jgi:SagB-type dehydrogenase family enzyme
MHIPANDKDWPVGWKIVEFKEYPRMWSFSLPPPSALNDSLGDVLKNRHSGRNFASKKTLTSGELSSLLFYGAGISRNRENPEKSRRFYPSGGGRYPLELYFYFRGNHEIPEGIYHYNIKRHAVEKMPVENVRDKILALPTYEFAYDAPFFAFVTSVWHRAMDKYKERGYRFAGIEAGIVLHNFYLVSTALRLECCGLGSIIDERVEEMLELDGQDEAFLVSFCVGKNGGHKK